jgi:hypothetical protein
MTTHHERQSQDGWATAARAAGRRRRSRERRAARHRRSLVGDQARKQLYATLTRHGGDGEGPEPTQRRRQ